MKITKNKKIFLFCLIFPILMLGLLTLIPEIPSAEAESELWGQQSGIKDVGNNAFGGETPKKDIRLIIASVIKIILGFLGIIFLILVIWAGFKYMTAEGNEDKIKESLSQIKTGIIGLIIILASYSITYFAMEYVRKAISSNVW